MMKRNGTALMIAAMSLLVAVAACGDECMCTLVACPEGIKVTLTNLDQAMADDFQLVMVDEAGDSAELGTPTFSTGPPDETNEVGWFVSTRDLPGRIETIRFRIDDADGTLVPEQQYTVGWKSSVCNFCSGGPSCSDHLAYTAAIAIELE